MSQSKSCHSVGDFLAAHVALLLEVNCNGGLLIVLKVSGSFKEVIQFYFISILFILKSSSLPCQRAMLVFIS